MAMLVYIRDADRMLCWMTAFCSTVVPASNGMWVKQASKRQPILHTVGGECLVVIGQRSFKLRQLVPLDDALQVPAPHHHQRQ